MHLTDNQEISGSSPDVRTIVAKLNWYKHQPYKLEIVGSTPTATTYLGMGERLSQQSAKLCVEV